MVMVNGERSARRNSNLNTQRSVTSLGIINKEKSIPVQKGKEHRSQTSFEVRDVNNDID